MANPCHYRVLLIDHGSSSFMSETPFIYTNNNSVSNNMNVDPIDIRKRTNEMRSVSSIIKSSDRTSRYGIVREFLTPPTIAGVTRINQVYW